MYYLFNVLLVSGQLIVTFKQGFSIIENGIEENTNRVHITGGITCATQNVFWRQIIQMWLYTWWNVHVPFTKWIIWLEKDIYMRLMD